MHDVALIKIVVIRCYFNNNFILTDPEPLFFTPFSVSFAFRLRFVSVSFAFRFRLPLIV